MSSIDDYSLVLAAIDEMPFNCGKKLLIEVLRGKNTERIRNLKLDRLECYGSMAYEEDELKAVMDWSIENGLIEQKSVPGRRYGKVLHLSSKGSKELISPSMTEKYEHRFPETIITDKDREVFSHFDFFLSKYDDEQKKAIISNANKILCVAGAGSGKTTVLTKRIEFLLKFRSVDPKRILAITFTRKARKEMAHRLEKSGAKVKIETFNSFCEKILRQHNDKIYDREVTVMSYGDKIKFVSKALNKLNSDFSTAIRLYFTVSQRRNKADEQLMAIFVNDCFTILDHYKNAGIELQDFSNAEELDEQDKRTAKLVYQVCSIVENMMKQNGKRDFSDQLVDCIRLFGNSPALIPKYDHILVDEYQDVNNIQIRLLDILNSDNLFCVGDPRQSIFGWRGSRIKHILKFEEKYPGCEIISLVNNYRSSQGIVKMMNSCIKKMNMPELRSNSDLNSSISLLSFESESDERFYVLSKIKEHEDKGQVYVLARTNKQLMKFSELLHNNQISHIVRTDEVKKTVSDKYNAPTLATVHAIKGLEADNVYVIGCNGRNFPCKASDHPIIDIIKPEEYDKFDEELRLFYVAISRARKNLVMSYSGTKSYFITDEMERLLPRGVSSDLYTSLINWRAKEAKDAGMPAYFIMHDSTLREIASYKPFDKEQLTQIKGMGPLKVMKYGRQILQLINGM